MPKRIYKVLSIDGGGMRGLFSASYLKGLVELAENRFDVNLSDLGKEFDLIVGTSTGAMLGAGLCAGVPLDKICSLYTNNGKYIFPQQLPRSKLRLLFHNRSKLNKIGEIALRNVLTELFGDLTLSELYESRKIGLLVPATNYDTHKAWAFKTPHDPTSSQRDNNYSLVDVCLASSAAPIYRSLAVVPQPDNNTSATTFVDGGLWANNPVLVALIEALRNTEPNSEIQIFSLGTISPPTGSVIDLQSPHWGLREWQFGGKAVELALDSQSFVSDQMAKMLTSHIDRVCSITRFPHPLVSGEQARLLQLDNSSDAAINLLQQLASVAVDDTNQLINSREETGYRIGHLLGRERGSSSAGEPFKEERSCSIATQN